VEIVNAIRHMCKRDAGLARRPLIQEVALLVASFFI